jgi:hypothetical protein
MSKVKLVLLSLVVASSVGAMSASSASAAIKFVWKVGGTELTSSTETRGFTVNNDEKKFTLSATIAGSTVKLLATLVEVLPNAQIVGGVPGTNTEQTVFLGVTVDKESCTAGQNGGTGTVQTVPLKTEIVEGASAERGNGEVDILFTPVSGTTFATFLFSGSPCLVSGATAGVVGSVLGLSLPQGAEVLRQNLVFEAVTKEYKNSAGAFKKAKLELGGELGTLTGLVLVILNSDAAYGPF